MSKSETLTDIQQKIAQIEKKNLFNCFCLHQVSSLHIWGKCNRRARSSYFNKVVQKVLVYKKGLHC